MKPDFTLPGYDVRAYWGPRRETPAAIAAKFKGYLQKVRAVDPRLDAWRSATAKGWRLYNGDLVQIERFVTEGVCRDDYGEPEVEFGYSFNASTPTTGPQGFGIRGNAGGWIPLPTLNSVGFRTEMGYRPDPDCVNYTIMHAVLLASVSIWSPLVCQAMHTDLRRKRPRSPHAFGPAWIQYVPPYLAAGVDPRGVPFVETAPDGGLVLIATRDLFDIENPAHLAGAEAIDRATAHLDWTDERPMKPALEPRAENPSLP